MGTKSLTREELFLVTLYKFSNERNIDFCSINKIAEPLGLRERQTKTTIQILANANFIKKNRDKEIAITSRGRNLAEELLNKS